MNLTSDVFATVMANNKFPFIHSLPYKDFISLSWYSITLVSLIKVTLGHINTVDESQSDFGKAAGAYESFIAAKKKETRATATGVRKNAWLILLFVIKI